MLDRLQITYILKSHKSKAFHPSVLRNNACAKILTTIIFAFRLQFKVQMYGTV